MTTDSPPKRRRKRGVILTEDGLARFRSAKTDDEYEKNRGNRYTLEVLSEKTGVSMDTLGKVFACETRVDKQTLKCCFSAFGLTLETSDYYSPGAVDPLADPCLGRTIRQDSRLDAIAQGTIAPTGSSAAPPVKPTNTSVPTSPLPPGGQLSVGSPFYIPRTKAEQSSFQAIEQPGALVRIKGARQSGKTSLMSLLAQQAQQQHYHAVHISFQLAEKSVLQDLDKLLRWFSASVGLGLSKAPNLDAYWDSLFGSKISCKLYFEQYLFPDLEQPTLLLLDDVECLFHYPEIADEFFGFVRTCYEEAKTSPLWQQVRIVIAQSSEVYIPLNINKSPFNVGVAISLEPFTPEQVQVLAAAYQITIELSEAIALCSLLSGHPYLSHLAIYHIWHGDTTLIEIIERTAQCPIFMPYLQQQQRRVQQDPSLAQAFSQLLSKRDAAGPAGTSSSPITSLPDIYRLQSLGLVSIGENGPQLSCDLLRQYFSD